MVMVLLLSCMWMPAPLCALAQPQPVDPHQQLDQILQQPLYQRWKLRQQRMTTKESGESAFLTYVREKIRSIGQAIGNAIARWFGSLAFPRTPSMGSVSTFMTIMKSIAWGALAIIVLFLAVMLYKAVRHARLHRLGSPVLSRQAVRQALAEGEALALDSSQWMAQANRLADERDFRSVYRALYLALLSSLHKAGKINFRRNRTNWTYVHHFKGPGADRNVFRDLTGLFDEVWYGLKPATGTHIASVKQQVMTLTYGVDRDN